MQTSVAPAGTWRDIDSPVVGREFDEMWQPASGPHAHCGGQILLLTRGVAVLEVEEGCWLIPAGRCVWVPPRWVHTGRCLGRYAGWEAIFSEQASVGLPNQIRVMHSSPLFQEILGRLLGGGDLTSSWDSKQQRLLAVLCDEILHSREHRFHIPIPSDPRLERIAQALIADVADPRSLEDWARWTGMSKRTLTRTFHRQMGMTFHRWRQHLRIFRALDLLLKDESVAAIAAAVGYESPSAFIAMFRSVLGVSPKAYLEQTAEPHRTTEALLTSLSSKSHPR